MHIQYELAQVTDLDRLLKLVEAFYLYDGHSFDPVIAEQAIRGLIEQEIYGRIWLIKIDGQSIGYVAVTFGYSLEYHGRDAIVDEIYLSEPYRGQGIGTKTFAFLETECRRMGINALHLEVMTDNQKAYEFYHRLGYEGRPSHFLHKWL